MIGQTPDLPREVRERNEGWIGAGDSALVAAGFLIPAWATVTTVLAFSAAFNPDRRAVAFSFLFLLALVPSAICSKLFDVTRGKDSLLDILLVSLVGLPWLVMLTLIVALAFATLHALFFLLMVLWLAVPIVEYALYRRRVRAAARIVHDEFEDGWGEMPRELRNVEAATSPRHRVVEMTLPYLSDEGFTDHPTVL